MKQLILFFIVAACLFGCTSHVTKNAETDSVSADTLTSTMYFARTDGNNDQDTTFVELLFNGKTVTGKMNWLPFEKDARKGLLSGTRDGDSINVVWSFKQEGSSDTLAVSFKLNGTKLEQKPFKVDSKTGRQFTDGAAGYTIKFKPIAGQKF